MWIFCSWHIEAPPPCHNLILFVSLYVCVCVIDYPFLSSPSTMIVTLWSVVPVTVFRKVPRESGPLWRRVLTDPKEDSGKSKWTVVERRKVASRESEGDGVSLRGLWTGGRKGDDEVSHWITDSFFPAWVESVGQLVQKRHRWDFIRNRQ